MNEWRARQVDIGTVKLLHGRRAEKKIAYNIIMRKRRV